MFKAIAFGLAVGAGVQAWRNWPADGPVTATAGILVMVLGIAAAYLGGRARRPAAAAVAVASAEATAVATNTVNVAVMVPEQRSEAAQGVRVPDESAHWILGPRSHVDEDLLDGADLRDLDEHYAHGVDE